MNWWPWISRTSHSVAMSRLEEECSELKEERRTLLDRLAVIGLGGPLYTISAEREPLEDAATETVSPDPDRELLEQMMRLRRRPAKLADQLTRQYRDAKRQTLRPGAAWIPCNNSEVDAALDHAEDMGKEVGRTRRGR